MRWWLKSIFIRAKELRVFLLRINAVKHRTAVCVWFVYDSYNRQQHWISLTLNLWPVWTRSSVAINFCHLAVLNRMFVCWSFSWNKHENVKQDVNLWIYLTIIVNKMRKCNKSCDTNYTRLYLYAFVMADWLAVSFYWVVVIVIVCLCGLVRNWSMWTHN